MSAVRLPILVLVVDRRAAGTHLADAVRAAVAAGVDDVQVRERDLDDAALIAHAREVSGAAHDGARDAGKSVRVLINRRVDVALAIGADGVHLGFDAMDAALARRLLGARARIGVSTHSAAEVAEIAAAARADHVHLAPIFDPLSKPAQRTALGPAAVAAAARAGVPVIAQGGITAANARAVCEAGAAGVAVTGAILLADDIARAARALRQALNSVRGAPTLPPPETPAGSSGDARSDARNRPR